MKRGASQHDFLQLLTMLGLFLPSKDFIWSIYRRNADVCCEGVESTVEQLLSKAEDVKLLVIMHLIHPILGNEFLEMNSKKRILKVLVQRRGCMQQGQKHLVIISLTILRSKYILFYSLLENHYGKWLFKTKGILTIIPLLNQCHAMGRGCKLGYILQCHI